MMKIKEEIVIPDLYTDSSQYNFVTSKLDQLTLFIAGSLLDSTNGTDFLASVKEFYFDDAIDFAERDKFLENFTKYMSDGYFIYPEVGMLKKVAHRLASSIYFYSFGYLGTYSINSGIVNNQSLGVPHGGELSYLFPIPSHNFTGTDNSISELMVDLWTSFVTNGKPTSKHLEDENFWGTYHPENTIYLQIGNINNNTDPRVSLSNNLFSNRMKFWKKNAPI